ncbi:hypothetical protein K501DRAFT_185562 [Backusella circina FSU 941]|nr:hypothetical protein K501DRAFT_185562 [Backusella circina FSU 941]
MDNAPIHGKAVVDPIIIKRGYIPVYLPPYSPELIPIEQFWKVLKDRVRRNKSNDVEDLTSRIIEGSEDVPVEHLQNFIQHSINFFPKCLKNLCNLFDQKLVKLFVKCDQFIFLTQVCNFFQKFRNLRVEALYVPL